MDRTFAQCLSEIEKSYLVLPKPIRIRIERWIEKLASTGNNPVWKRDRNEYAKLLLNMITARRLEAPFNCMPPEGPLPPFPSQNRGQSRHLLGAHETSFWRELYQRFDHDQDEPDHAGPDSFAFREKKQDPIAAAMQEKLGRPPSKVAGSSEANNVALSREIQTLNMLIREQTQRIRLLEQQLHDERTQHELQIQRLNYSHRVETNNLKAQIEQFAMEMSVQALSPSRTETRSFLREQSFDQPAVSSPTVPRFAQRFLGSMDGNGDKGSRTGTPSRFSPTRRAPAAMVSPNKTLPKHSFLSFLEQKNHITAMLNSRDSLDANTFDITPRPKSSASRSPQRTSSAAAAVFMADPAPASEEKEESADVAGSGAAAAAAAVEESRFEDSGLDVSLRWGGNHHHHHQHARYDTAAADAEDEAFLAQIEKFQSEIKKINTTITMTSPDRF